MVNSQYLNIQSDNLSLEIPLINTNESCPHPIKAYLSLKPAGDMAFSKRNMLPFREMFFNRHHIDKSRVYSLYQEHTKHVVKIEKRNKPEVYQTVTGDGMITAEKDIFLSVTVADCLPIFIIDKELGAFGLVHSGWKGTGIAKIAVKHMEKKYGSKKAKLKLVIGPGIGSCCYNVEEKRYKRFLSRFGQGSCRKEQGKYYIDLKKVNLILLQEEGISDIDIIENCTCCNQAFHSFRREGKEHFSVMMAITGYFP